MKLSRRKLAKSVIGAALATTATQELAAQSPANADESSSANQTPNQSPPEGSVASPNTSPDTGAPADPNLEAALADQRADRRAMDAVPVPMTTPPAVHFRPRT